MIAVWTAAVRGEVKGTGIAVQKAAAKQAAAKQAYEASQCLVVRLVILNDISEGPVYSFRLVWYN